MNQQAAIKVQATELSEFRYIAVSKIGKLTPPRLVQRPTAAHDALHAATTAYLEHGRRVATDVK
jgi:hypothetical protein